MPHLIGDIGGGLEPMSVPYGDFYVEGTPLPQPRPGFRIATPKGGKPFVLTYTQDHKDKRHAKWRKAVWTAASFICPKEPLDEPVILTINIYAPRPQALMGKKYFDGPIPHDRQGDVDNYAKAIMDACSPDEKQGRQGLWVNDGRVIAGHWMKFYAAKNRGPGMYVLLETVDPDSQVNFPTNPPLFTGEME